MLILSIVVSLAAGFVPLGGLCSFQRTFFFFPFFLLGYLVHQEDLWGKIRSLRKTITIPIILVYFTIICFIPNFPDSMLTGSFYYMSGLADWRVMFGLRAFAYLWTLPLTICVLSVIPDIKFFQKNGKDTMFYLLYHPFFIWIIKQLIIKYNLPTNIGAIILYMIANMFIMYWLNKVTLFRFLTKPFSIFKNKKNVG